MAAAAAVVVVVVVHVVADGAGYEGGDQDGSRRGLACVSATVDDLERVWIVVEPLHFLLCLAAVVTPVSATVVTPAMNARR